MGIVLLADLLVPTVKPWLASITDPHVVQDPVPDPIQLTPTRLVELERVRLQMFFQQYNLSIMQSVVGWMHGWEIAYSEEPCRWRDNYKLYAEFQHQRGSWQHPSRLFRGQLYKVVKRNFKVLALFISFSAFNSQVPTNESFPSHKTATWIYPLICNDRENSALYTELSWGGRGAVTKEWG